MILNWNKRSFEVAVNQLLRTGTADTADEFIANFIVDFVRPYQVVYGRTAPDEEIFWVVAETNEQLKKGKRDVETVMEKLGTLNKYAAFFETIPEDFPDLYKSYRKLVEYYQLKRPLPTERG